MFIKEEHAGRDEIFSLVLYNPLKYYICFYRNDGHYNDIVNDINSECAGGDFEKYLLNVKMTLSDLKVTTREAFVQENPTVDYIKYVMCQLFTADVLSFCRFNEDDNTVLRLCLLFDCSVEELNLKVRPIFIKNDSLGKQLYTDCFKSLHNINTSSFYNDIKRIFDELKED